MDSSASSSTTNPPRKVGRTSIIDISSSELSPLQENNHIATTLTTTLALWLRYKTRCYNNLRVLMSFLDDERVLMPRVVKSRDEIFSRWGYCDNHDLSRLDNQSIERDRLIGIGFVLDFVEFISFTFGDKEMISVIEAVSR
ncbi:hypothetical protein Tco_0087859 [Tanacetum coccineum]